MIKLKNYKRYIYTTAFLTVSAGIFAIYQNFTYDAPNLYQYYLTEVAKCTASNYTLCSGEVVSITYDKDQPIGAYRALDLDEYTERDINYSLVPGSTNNFVIRYSYPPYFRLGINSMSLSKLEPRQISTVRSTGVYVTEMSNRDSFFNPKTVKEESRYFNANNQTLVSGFSREKRYGYFNSIQTDSTGRFIYIVGAPSEESVVGGATNQRTFYPNGLIFQTREKGILKEYEYDSLGNVKKIYSYRDGVKRAEVDYANFKFGVPQTTTNGEGEITSLVLDKNGQVESRTDALGYITKYKYDLLGRETEVLPPSGSSTSISYPSDLRIERQTGPLKQVTIKNSYGETIESREETIEGSIVTSYSYDAAGRQKFKSFPANSVASKVGTSTEYDILNRPVVIRRNSDGATTNYVYGTPDKVTKIDPENFYTYIYYKNYGAPENKLVYSTQAGVTAGKVSYDTTVVANQSLNVNDQATEISMGGQKRTRNFDLGTTLLKSSVDPDTGTKNFSYYSNTSLLKTASTALGSVEYGYDLANRKTNSSFSDGGISRYKYYPDSAIKRVENEEGSRDFKYDDRGNKIFERITIDGFVFEFDYKYDGNNQLIEILYPNGSVFNGGIVARNNLVLTKNNFGRVTKMKDSSRILLNSVSYWPNGVFDEMVYGNNAISKLTLNGSNLPGNLAITSGANSQIYVYGYDRNSNLKSISASQDTRYSQSFTYDGLGRLTSHYYGNAAALVPAGSPKNLGGSYGYDSVGNLIQFTEFSKATTKISGDQNPLLLNAATGGYTSSLSYDGAGNCITDGSKSYEYNVAGRLQKISNSGQLVASFGYDSDGLRVKKKVKGETTYYVYSGNQLLLEASQSLGVKEYYYFGTNLTASRTVKNQVATYRFYHFNPLHSVVASSAADGSIIFENYNPFGSSMLANASFQATTPLRFAGQYSDDETGLIYMGQRYYHPKLGRFLQPDSVDFQTSNIQSFNKYVYANNNPMKFVDPDGRLPIFLPLLFAGLTGYEIGSSIYGLYSGSMTRTEAAFNLAMAVMPMPVPFKMMPKVLDRVLVAHGGSFAKDFPGSYIKVQSNVTAYVFNTMEGQATSPFIYEHMIRGNPAAFQNFRSMVYGPGTMLPNKLLSDASADFFWYNKQFPLVSVEGTTTLREVLTNFSKAGGGCIGIHSCNGSSTEVYYRTLSSGFGVR